MPSELPSHFSDLVRVIPDANVPVHTVYVVGTQLHMCTRRVPADPHQRPAWPVTLLLSSKSDGNWRYRAWRRKAERFARRHGFYWMPCILCGKPHGGQEDSGSIYTGNENGGEHYTQICPECTARRQQAAERRLRELGETVEVWGGTSSWSGPFGRQTIS